MKKIWIIAIMMVMAMVMSGCAKERITYIDYVDHPELIETARQIEEQHILEEVIEEELIEEKIETEGVFLDDAYRQELEFNSRKNDWGH